MEARFNKLYENQGFFDLYNGSVMVSLFVLFIFFIIFSFFYVKHRTGPIKQNWSQERCSPTVMPFAGMINAPSNKGIFEYTTENFNYCIKNIIKESTAFAVEPINHIVRLFEAQSNNLNKGVNDARKVMSGTRSTTGGVSEEIMGRTLNMLIPIQKMIIRFKDTMGKAHAVLTSAMYSAIGGLWFMISAIISVYDLIIAILIGLGIAIAALWLIPFGFGIPFAIAMTLTFIAIAIPLGLIGGAMGDIISLTNLNQSISRVPSAPSCFKKGTLIRGKNNVLYSIESIPLGTELTRGGIVTAVLKLDASKETMYKLGNVVVSGWHKVRHNKEWVFIRNHPDAKKLSNFRDKFIYCLNTTKKIIPVGDYTFQDWDEMDKETLKRCGCETEESVFENLENGFHPETVLNTKNIGKIPIKNVDVGDILKTGEIVTGIVQILNNKELVEYEDGFIGTRRFTFLENLGILSSSHQRSNIIYHILTDQGHLHIKEKKLMDYNWNIDIFNI